MNWFSLAAKLLGGGKGATSADKIIEGFFGKINKRLITHAIGDDGYKQLINTSVESIVTSKLGISLDIHYNKNNDMIQIDNTKENRKKFADILEKQKKRRAELKKEGKFVGGNLGEDIEGVRTYDEEVSHTLKQMQKRQDLQKKIDRLEAKISKDFDKEYERLKKKSEKARAEYERIIDNGHYENGWYSGEYKAKSGVITEFNYNEIAVEKMKEKMLKADKELKAFKDGSGVASLRSQLEYAKQELEKLEDYNVSGVELEAVPKSYTPKQLDKIREEKGDKAVEEAVAKRKEEQEKARERNREKAKQEVAAFANYDSDETLHNMIKELYEDEEHNSDIIAEMKAQGNKFSDLLQERIRRRWLSINRDKEEEEDQPSHGSTNIYGDIDEDESVFLGGN